MQDFDNYLFDVSISQECYATKPDKPTLEKMRYTRESLTYYEFLDKIEHGYAFCYVFKGNWRNIENFKFTHFLAYDIDDVDCDFDSAIEKCPNPPTLAYRTYSDGENGKCSYRFIYAFESDEFINTFNFREAYDNVALANGFKLDLDKKAEDCARLFFGTDKNDSFIGGKLYRLSDFDISQGIYSTHTPLILSEDGTYYTFPDEYYEIKRLWGFDPNTKRKFIRKYTDEGKLSRRKQLFIDGQLFKKINNITDSNFLYKILKKELGIYYDNTVDTITDDEIKGIAERVIQKEFKCKPCTKHPSFKINVQYWKRVMNVGNNIYKPIVAVNRIKKQIKVDMFKQLYNPSLTNSENLKIMEENGLKIDKRTLQRYKKEYSNCEPIVSNTFLDKSLEERCQGFAPGYDELGRCPNTPIVDTDC